MKNLRFAFRWTISFGLIYLFTIQSLYFLGFFNTNAYAQTINSSSTLQSSSNVVVLKGQNYVICSLDSDQLALLKTKYNVNITTVNLDGRDVTMAVVTNSESTANDIYYFLGFDKSGQSKCTVVKQDKNFFLFLMPGVS